jgi:hypothetical protein
LPPEAGVQRLVDPVLRHEHHERRQVPVRGAEAVAQPAPDARAAGEVVAGLAEGDRRVVVDVLGVDRLHEAQVVGDAGGPRQQLANGGPALAVPVELEDRPGHRQRRLVGGHAGDALAHPHGLWQVLSVPVVQERLVVEKVELARPAGHEQRDDPLRLRGVVRAVEYAGDRAPLPGVGAEQVGQRGAGDAQPEPGEQRPAVDGDIDVAAEHGGSGLTTRHGLVVAH